MGTKIWSKKNPHEIEVCTRLFYFCLHHTIFSDKISLLLVLPNNLKRKKWISLHVRTNFDNFSWTDPWMLSVFTSSMSLQSVLCIVLTQKMTYYLQMWWKVNEKWMLFQIHFISYQCNTGCLQSVLAVSIQTSSKLTHTNKRSNCSVVDLIQTRKKQLSISFFWSR